MVSPLGFRRLAGMSSALLLAIAGLAASPVGPARADSLSFDTERISPVGFEPRIAVGPDNQRWVSSEDRNGAWAVFGSRDGHAWSQTSASPQVDVAACCDNDMAVTPNGRLVASVIDQSLQFAVAYSDDGGRTWTESKGTRLADQDRQWFATGPKDSVTGQYTVYMLWHNLGSGSVDHEMMVSTSRDNGATFLPPVPVSLPGSQAWLDLQCADSGGPSNIVVNPTSGQIYAVFGTRSSALGGCGASVLGPFEINVVAATRVWVSTSKDEGVTWSPALAVDDSSAGNIVGMQLAAGAVDNAGNVYVVYPESPNPYPNYDGAAIKYRWAPADLSSWSAPVTVAASGGAGHVLPYMVAGDPGKLAFFYVSGVAQASGDPRWYATMAETINGLSPAPTITEARITNTAMLKGTASQLMGVCDTVKQIQTPPLETINRALGGFTCSRATDVLGMSVDATCHFMSVWSANSGSDIGSATDAAPGTYVSTLTSGPTLGSSCSVGGLPAAAAASTPTPAPPSPSPSASPAAVASPAPTPLVSAPVRLPNSSAAGVSAAILVLALMLVGLAGSVVRRRV